MGLIADTLHALGDVHTWMPQFERHLMLSLVALALSLGIGIPVGAWLTRRESIAFAVTSVANLGRTIPSLALLALAYPVVGTGIAPSIIALVAMGMPPILLATYTGIREVDADMRDAAAGMGLTSMQRLIQVELPVASPVILSGIRTAAVQIVASATLASLIGGGGLGETIMAGLTNLRYDLLLAGAILVALLAAATELAFVWLERRGLPLGIRMLRSSPLATAMAYRAGGGVNTRSWRVVAVAVAVCAASFVGVGSMANGMIASIGRASLGNLPPLPGVTVRVPSDPAGALKAELYAQALEDAGHEVTRTAAPAPAHRIGASGASHAAFSLAANVSGSGPAFAPTVDAVGRKLSAPRLAELVTQVQHGAAPADIAKDYLRSVGLNKRGPRPLVRIGSKDFTEQYVLAELYAQALESRGFPVERHLGLGATAVADAAVRAGRIDFYPEYTGTSYTAVLGKPVHQGMRADATWRTVRDAYRSRDMRVLHATPFSNGNAIVVTKATADKYHLRTLGDLAKVSGELTFGAIPGFDSRADGMPLLQQVYGMQFGTVRSYQDSLKYAALADGKVDAVYGFETDGPIAARHLVTLTDNKHAWPAYQAAPILSRKFAGSVGPDFAATLDHVSSLLDADTMRRLNAAVDQQGREPEDVAHDFLREHHLLAR
jgi:osmoprotectant transport system substrate-binding protein